MQHDSQAEDLAAEALADAVIALVHESHPHASPKFRRRVARLYLRQLTGSEKPPGQISTARVGKALGLSQQRASETQASALAKAYLRLRHLSPPHHP